MLFRSSHGAPGLSDLQGPDGERRSRRRIEQAEVLADVERIAEGDGVTHGYVFESNDAIYGWQLALKANKDYAKRFFCMCKIIRIRRFTQHD